MADLSRDHTDCQHAFSLSKDEYDSLRWLNEVLDKVGGKSGQNQKKAKLATAMLERLFEHDQLLHLRIHQLEVHLATHGANAATADSSRWN